MAAGEASAAKRGCLHQPFQRGNSHCSLCDCSRHYRSRVTGEPLSALSRPVVQNPSCSACRRCPFAPAETVAWTALTARTVTNSIRSDGSTAKSAEAVQCRDYFPGTNVANGFALAGGAITVVGSDNEEWHKTCGMNGCNGKAACFLLARFPPSQVTGRRARGPRTTNPTGI